MRRLSKASQAVRLARRGRRWASGDGRSWRAWPRCRWRLAVWWFFGRQAVRLPPPRVMSLTSYPGIEVEAVVFADGKQVAFSWDGENAGQRGYLRRDCRLGLAAAALTRDTARDVSPAWKPDGSRDRVRTCRRRSRGHLRGVAARRIGAEARRVFGSSAATVLLEEANDPALCWSPDGRWLAVSHVTSGAEGGVYLVDQNGGITRLLPPAKAGANYYATAFSPKGDALAYVDSGYIDVVEAGLRAIRRLSANAPRRLTSFLGFVHGLAWTVDGRELLFGRAPYAASSARLSVARCPLRRSCAGAHRPRRRRRRFPRCRQPEIGSRTAAGV